MYHSGAGAFALEMIEEKKDLVWSLSLCTDTDLQPQELFPPLVLLSVISLGSEFIRLLQLLSVRRSLQIRARE